MAISPQRLTIYLYSAHRAVIFAIAQLSCCCYYRKKYDDDDNDDDASTVDTVSELVWASGIRCCRPNCLELIER